MSAIRFDVILNLPFLLLIKLRFDLLVKNLIILPLLLF